MNFHPAMEEAERAVVRVMRRSVAFSTEAARRMIRVEINHDTRMQLRMRLDHHLVLPNRPEGPLQIMGISYYVVDELPEPGWRVICPLDD